MGTKDEKQIAELSKENWELEERVGALLEEKDELTEKIATLESS